MKYLTTKKIKNLRIDFKIFGKRRGQDNQLQKYVVDGVIIILLARIKNLLFIIYTNKIDYRNNLQQSEKIS